MSGICVLMVAGFLMFGREDFFRLPSAYGLLALILILTLLTWFSVRRPEVGLWVLAGFAALTAGTLFTLFRNLDWMPVTFATQYGPQIGGALEIPLVLIGLYFRSRERRDNRVRLEALSHTDPLTGVGNHRVLVERLHVLLGGGRRRPFSGAVLQVHVANLDEIRDEYGREAAEAAIVRAAECVTLEAARSRHGGARAGRRPGAAAGGARHPGPGRRGRTQHHRPRAQVLRPPAAARDAGAAGGRRLRARFPKTTRRRCWACWAA